MRLKTSFFSGAVYRKNLTRFAPLWILYLVVWLFILPLSILSQASRQPFALGDLQHLVYQAGLQYGGPLSLIYAVVLAMALHAWYYSARSVNAMAALPIRREAWCVTNLLSALTFSLVPGLIAALLTWAAAASVGLPGFSIAFQWFSIVSMQFIFYYGLAAFCAAITGHLAALPVLYLLSNFVGVILSSVAAAVFSTFVYGMRSGSYMSLVRFSPVAYVAQRLSAVAKTTGVGEHAATSYVFHGWDYLHDMALIGLILLVLAFFLFRYRRMESTGEVIAIRCLRQVLKYSFSIFTALALGVLAAMTFFADYNNPPPLVMVLCMLCGCFIGYFTAEILLKKTFRVFGREWIGFAAVSLCLLAAVGMMEFDVTGFERRVPDVEEVESITLTGTSFWNSVILTDEAYITDLITLHHSFLDHKEEQEALARQFPKDSSDMDYTQVDLVYQLKDGRILARSYQLYCTEEMWLDGSSLPRQYDGLCRDPQIISLQNTPSFDVTPSSISYASFNIYDPETDSYGSESMTVPEAYNLYTTCILPDLQEGLVGYTPPFRFGLDTEDRYEADIYIACAHTLDAAAMEQGQITLVTDSIYIVPTVGSRTARWLEEHGYSLTLATDVTQS